MVYQRSGESSWPQRARIDLAFAVMEHGDRGRPSDEHPLGLVRDWPAVMKALKERGNNFEPAAGKRQWSQVVEPTLVAARTRAEDKMAMGDTTQYTAFAFSRNTITATGRGKVATRLTGIGSSFSKPQEDIPRGVQLSKDVGLSKVPMHSIEFSETRTTTRDKGLPSVRGQNRPLEGDIQEGTGDKFLKLEEDVYRRELCEVPGFHDFPPALHEGSSAPKQSITSTGEHFKGEITNQGPWEMGGLYDIPPSPQQEGTTVEVIKDERVDQVPWGSGGICCTNSRMKE